MEITDSSELSAGVHSCHKENMKERRQKLKETVRIVAFGGAIVGAVAMSYGLADLLTNNVIDPFLVGGLGLYVVSAAAMGIPAGNGSGPDRMPWG